MKSYDSSFLSSLDNAQNTGIEPVWFLYIKAAELDGSGYQDVGLWSGDEDITVNVKQPDGTLVARVYFGNCGLSSGPIPLLGSLTDTPIDISLNPLSDSVQSLIYGYNLKVAYCEIHSATWNKGNLSVNPQFEYAGSIDAAPISTAAASGESSVALSIRSDIMYQLSRINPAMSSDQHQKRRLSTDRFCEYAGVIKSRKIQWFKG